MRKSAGVSWSAAASIRGSAACGGSVERSRGIEDNLFNKKRTDPFGPVESPFSCRHPSYTTISISELTATLATVAATAKAYDDKGCLREQANVATLRKICFCSIETVYRI